MSHFTAEEKTHFKEHGYVIKHDLLRQELIDNAIDVLWQHIEANRDNPDTWTNAGPSGNLPCSDHPDIIATLHDTPIYDHVGELAGKDKLTPPGRPLCKMNYPTGNDPEDWEAPPRGHLDGYITDGVASTFTVGATVNISDIKPRGGGFTVWPGTHLRVAEYFKTHSLLTGWDINRNEIPELADLPEPVECAGPPGTVVFWHHYMLHRAGINCQRDIRMAFVSRFNFKNLRQIQFDLPHDLWGQWEGLS
ncbi:MAG: phytanoyl-CoA dioxygenase family protein [bacterium]|nr:phytanoyl-CoA dioxygenase family protein [bacterium]